ncbi:GFA family protein [Marinobacter sp. X15-166B]|uniref:GFA family protein n=1 Tax=Marinobacter sp. X15-166B TaxID=1897620 RepID=UPI00085C3349|nr:GFA family protein [Marinobacter sp. X15-166B]OEY65960.1 aldehyde-activating protein [Marinobacter sp. X15-166B]
MKGTCLCGSIEVVADSQADVAVCHCSMCRRWSGGPMFAVHCDSSVTFTGGEPATYQSSDWAQRGFCPTCGTHLFYHLLPGDEYIIPAGLFQNEPFVLTSQIFIDEKPPYYDLKNQTPTLTGQEVFEKYAPKA